MEISQDTRQQIIRMIADYKQRFSVGEIKKKFGLDNDTYEQLFLEAVPYLWR